MHEGERKGINRSFHDDQLLKSRFESSVITAHLSPGAVNWYFSSSLVGFHVQNGQILNFTVLFCIWAVQRSFFSRGNMFKRSLKCMLLDLNRQTSINGLLNAKKKVQVGRVKDGELMVFCGAMIIAPPFTHVRYRLSIVCHKFFGLLRWEEKKTRIIWTAVFSF